MPLNDWDANRGRSKGTIQNARMLNNYLEAVKMSIFKCYQDLKLEGKLITSKAVKARYLGVDKQNRSVLEIIDCHNEDMKNKLKRGTQKNY
ncbi:hypothetical protein [Neotamlana nanhaiensis]|uniref:hypothetical protein n=1 Tax=Neotamlana nanhaiensis TaxID=1382798 RepID=UPI001EE1AA03|nr:hypothetical protein [Tamlana nanhaiensis]